MYCTGSSSGSDSDSGDDSTVGNPNSLLDTFKYFEDDSDDTLLEKNPVPPLRPLDQTSLDLGSVGVTSPVIVSQSKSKRSSRSKKIKPSNQNSRHLRRREKNKLAKSLDDCRPDSEKDRFNSIQTAKHRDRLASRASLFSPNLSDMAGKALPTRSKKNDAVNASDEENIDSNRKRKATTNESDRDEDDVDSPQQPARAIRNGQGAVTMDSIPPANLDEFNAILKEQLEADKRLSKDKRSDVLKGLRRAHLIVRFDNQRLRAYKGQVEKNNAEIKKLQAELDECKKSADARISKGKAKVLRENEDEKDKIDKLVASELWRTCKFINCKEDEDRASEFLYKLIYGEKKLNMDAMYSWIATYKTHIKKALYAKRNYATSQIKLSAWNKFEAKENLPTVAMVRKCVNRTIDVNNVEEMEAFTWYWEVLLPKMVGANEWGSTVRYYTTISAAKLPNDPRNRKLVTYSHEGMLLAIWDNNFEKWHELYAWSQEPENMKKKQRNTGGKYTSTNRGQRQFGGWEPNGIDAYNLYCEEAKAGRSGPNRKLLEKTTLALLRQKYMIDQADHDTQTRVNRNRKRKKSSPDELPFSEPMQRIVKTNMLDEEEASGDEDSDDGN